VHPGLAVATPPSVSDALSVLSIFTHVSDALSVRSYYSGKKKQHTLKSQVAVNHDTGEICDVSVSVVGPTADISLLAQSELIARLPEGVGLMGDLAYMGCDKLHPQALGFAPRRKPRSKPRPPADVIYWSLARSQ
jgi:hypothetical protein